MGAESKMRRARLMARQMGGPLAEVTYHVRDGEGVDPDDPEVAAYLATLPRAIRRKAMKDIRRSRKGT